MGKERALKRTRVVFDTNVLISAWFWNGNESRLVELVERGEIDGYASPQMLRELMKALGYPKFELNEAEIETIFSYYALTLNVVEPKHEVNVVEDGQDNRVLECAMEAKANYIVSGDHHLLLLRKFEGIRIVKAKELLRELSVPR